jgi:hypothetical protein
MSRIRSYRTVMSQLFGGTELAPIAGRKYANRDRRIQAWSILWETTESYHEKKTWQAQASMVAPANESGIPETTSDIQADRLPRN